MDRLDARWTVIAVRNDIADGTYAEGVTFQSPGSRQSRVPRVMRCAAIWLPQRGWTIARRSWRCSCCTNDWYAASRVCKTPLGFGFRAAWTTQGAPLARRPWALECNAFGVKTNSARHCKRGVRGSNQPTCKLASTWRSASRIVSGPRGNCSLAFSSSQALTVFSAEMTVLCRLLPKYSPIS